MKPLTAKAIEKITRPGRYAVGDGAYFQVTGENGRSWIFRYETAGANGKRKGHWVGLGPYPLVSLQRARQKAREMRLMRLDGVDPLAHKRSQKQQAAVAVAAAKGVTFQ